MAEAEKLKQEAWANRVNRSKLRIKGKQEAEKKTEDDAAEQQTEAAAPDPEVTGGSEPTDSVTENPDPAPAKER